MHDTALYHGGALKNLFLGYIFLAVIFALIEKLWPSIRGQPLWRTDSRTDLVYWFFTPLVTKSITKVAVVVAVVFLAVQAGVSPNREQIQVFIARDRLATHWPLGLQVIAVLVLGDLIGYWMHRLFHGRVLWKFHAVHHGSRQLDWLSSVRLHPVNDVLAKVAQVVPIFLLGFKPTVLAAYAPFIAFYAILLHANVSWDFGPLRRILASPTFHRWHHTSQDEGLDKNFAGLFPFIDILFGTFHMPQGRTPRTFGILGTQVPEGFLAQLAYPFRRS